MHPTRGLDEKQTNKSLRKSFHWYQVYSYDVAQHSVIPWEQFGAIESYIYNLSKTEKQFINGPIIIREISEAVKKIKPGKVLIINVLEMNSCNLCKIHWFLPYRKKKCIL